MQLLTVIAVPPLEGFQCRIPHATLIGPSRDIGDFLSDQIVGHRIVFVR